MNTNHHHQDLDHGDKDAVHVAHEEDVRKEEVEMHRHRHHYEHHGGQSNGVPNVAILNESKPSSSNDGRQQRQGEAVEEDEGEEGEGSHMQHPRMGRTFGLQDGSVTVPPEQEDEEIEEEDVEVAAHSSFCNRRLSRAARYMISEDVIPVLATAYHAYLHHNDLLHEHEHNDELSSFSVEERILMWAIDNYQQHQDGLASCPLDPRRDILRHHEAAHKIVDAPKVAPVRVHTTGRIPTPPTKSKTVQPQQTSTPSSSTSTSSSLAAYAPISPQHLPASPLFTSYYTSRKIHQCGLCGKQFVSRFYLDRHMDSRHKHQLQPNNHTKSANTLNSPSSSLWTCPATQICPALWGDHYCAILADRLEPNYHPGTRPVFTKPNMSNPQQQQHHDDHSQYKPKLPPCSEYQMSQARSRCTTLMNTCFGGTPRHDSPHSNQNHENTLYPQLIQQVCQALTCVNRLHHMASPLQLVDRQKHDSMHTSRNHAQMHSVAIPPHADYDTFHHHHAQNHHHRKPVPSQNSHSHPHAAHAHTSIGFTGYLLVILLSLFYLAYYVRWRVLRQCATSSVLRLRRRPVSHKSQSFSKVKSAGVSKHGKSLSPLSGSSSSSMPKNMVKSLCSSVLGRSSSTTLQHRRRRLSGTSEEESQQKQQHFKNPFLRNNNLTKSTQKVKPNPDVGCTNAHEQDKDK